MFFESQTTTEQNHMIKALRFELGKVENAAVRLRMLGLLSQVNYSLAEKVAKGLGMKVPASPEKPMNHGVGADDFGTKEPKEVSKDIQVSDALSMIKNPTVTPTIASRKVAFMCNDGVSEASVMGIKKHF